MLDVAVRGDIPAGCCTNIFGVLAANDDLLSLPLSSKGGEGKATSAHGDACKEQRVREPVPLHPNPHPQGEGTAKAGAQQTDEARFAEARATIPPLPKGEGRGEGKGTVENAPVPKADSEPSLPGT